MEKGKLYLIPTPISNKFPISKTLLPNDIPIVSEIGFFIVETAKTARYFLKDLDLKKPIQEISIRELNEHTDESDIQDLLEPIMSGYNMGLLSDAGVPSVADPGYRIVSLAQSKGIKVVPLVGPSSILLALMASGLNGQSFAFNGYLPKEKGLRRKRIKSLEKLAISTNQTQIFMEVPYKNNAILEDVLAVCYDNTRLCIANNIMSEKEIITTKNIGQWKRGIPLLEKSPCLFLINR